MAYGLIASSCDPLTAITTTDPVVNEVPFSDKAGVLSRANSLSFAQQFSKIRRLKQTNKNKTTKTKTTNKTKKQQQQQQQTNKQKTISVNCLPFQILPF